MNTSPTRVRIVDPSELRRIFRDSGLLGQYQRGQLTEEVKRSRHVDNQRHRLYCTQSEVVRLFDGDHKVAVIHRYWSAKGTLSASDQPGPKMVRIGDDVYICRTCTDGNSQKSG